MSDTTANGDGDDSPEHILEQPLDALSSDDARKLDDELGIGGSQAIGGLAGDDGP